MSMKVVVLSDIHIGDNSSTCWYQKKYHEPYLLKALDYIAQNAASINEVILLGDVFDFWTYPCSRKPPSFDDIVKANPNVLGPGGKLGQIADKVPVTYINGNHDMNVGKNDIVKLGKIRYNDGLRYVKDTPGGNVLFTHGSEYTIFNAQDHTTTLNPLPIGHFVTRALSEYLVKSKLKPGQTAADLENNGTPPMLDLLPKLLEALKHPESLAQILLDTFSSLPGVTKDTKVLLLDGRTVTFAEAEKIYGNLGTQWVQRYGLQDTTKSVIADTNGDYIAWWAQRDAIQGSIDADVAILGHTHIPKGGLKEAMIRYLNCGFMCSPLPAGTLQKPLTFGEIDLESGKLSLMSASKPDTPFAPQTFPDDTLVFYGAQDFSCFVSILNGTYFAMNLKNQQEVHGKYIVPPPAQINAMQRARFWIQDYPGAQGTEGSAAYANAGSGKSITFSYACPLVMNNSCSPVPFRNKSDSGSWQNNTVVKRGHPYFVDFTAEK